MMIRFDEIMLMTISKYLDYRNLSKIMVLIPRDLRENIDNFIRFMPEYYFMLSLKTKSRLREKECMISWDPKRSYMYAFHVLNGRWPIEDGRQEKEYVISRDPEWSYMYAQFVLRGRWPLEGDGSGREEKENVIGRDPKWSYSYAFHILGMRWPVESGREEKEQVISQDPEWSYMYARHVIRGRWPLEDGRDEKEKIISNSRMYVKYLFLR